MNLDARELAVLRAVIERGSVTGAAQALHVSQPAVSRTLLLVEQRLGIALFRRERQRLYPTPEAEMLYGDIVQAVTSIEAVERRARDLRDGRSGALRIASIAAFANSIVPRTVGRLRQRKPGVEYVIDVLTAREVAQRVATFRAEVGLLIDTATLPDIHIEELITFPFGCLMPRSHRLAERPCLSVTDLVNEPLICLNRALPLGVLAHRLMEQHDLALRPVRRCRIPVSRVRWLRRARASPFWTAPARSPVHGRVRLRSHRAGGADRRPARAAPQGRPDGGLRSILRGTEGAGAGNLGAGHAAGAASFRRRIGFLRNGLSAGVAAAEPHCHFTRSARSHNWRRRRRPC